MVILSVDIKNIIRINKEIQRKDFYNFKISIFCSERKQYTQKNFDSGLTMYFAHHCWDTPSPCGEGFSDKIVTSYKHGYYFIKIRNNSYIYYFINKINYIKI